jgi:flagellar hook-basal body complex protein FliE
MRIDGFAPIVAPEHIGSRNDVQKSPSNSFSSYLEQSLTDVNEMLNESDQKNTDLAIGKSENLHEAMIASEKAESALKLMVQTRNRALEAYNDILRMQF